MASAAPAAVKPFKVYEACPECGGTLPAPPPDAKRVGGRPPKYCSPACKKAFQNRQAVHGRAIIGYAKSWRISRNNPNDKRLGAACLSHMSTVLDHLNEEDRKQGRTSLMTLSYAQSLLGDECYWDRSYDPKAAEHRLNRPDILEGLESIDQRLGGQLTNMEANALRYALEKYRK